MNISGYKQVTYLRLQQLMAAKYEKYKEGSSEILLAVSLNVKSSQTVRNAFQQDMQMVSDSILTSIIEAIGLNACVVWEKGQRNYFVKGK